MGCDHERKGFERVQCGNIEESECQRAKRRNI